ncbi:MAG: nucleotidyltransferase domain-containing protein [Pseudomonadota bacterium]
MRLTISQRTFVLQIVTRIAGPDARVILFGSRLDDTGRGGDLDLLIESNEMLTLMQRASIKLALESSLDMPVDIIVIKRGAPPTAFQRIALTTGIPLGAA